MKLTRQDLIWEELGRADESLSMAKLALEAQYWNSAAVELYYTCYYFIQALFLALDVQAHTHAGMKSLFSQKFIKENLIDEKYAKLLGQLLIYRHEGNYGGYKVTEEAILPYQKEVEGFKTAVLALLQQLGYKINNES